MDDLEKLTRRVDHIYHEMYFNALSNDKIINLLEEQNKLMRLYLESKGIQINKAEKEKKESYDLFASSK